MRRLTFELRSRPVRAVRACSELLGTDGDKNAHNCYAELSRQLDFVASVVMDDPVQFLALLMGKRAANLFHGLARDHCSLRHMKPDNF